MKNPSEITVKIRGYHLDVFGVVNHARYVEFFEEARWAYMEERPALARALAQAKVPHSVVNINIDYRRPARLGDVLRIQSEPSRAGRGSITFSQRGYLNDEEKPAVQALVTNVFFRAASGEVVSTDDPVFESWEELAKLY